MHPGSEESYSAGALLELLPGLTNEQRWRMTQFLEMGYDDRQAELLALSDADVHVTRRMIGQGCSLEHALEIGL